MSSPDAIYASYGWWIHKSEDGAKYTASAFHDEKGGDPAITALPVAGTATYMGGAAGKYALSSATGGTNDAGDFTATATLEAEFGTTPMISGTIDDFMGADGQPRDWEVELMDQGISATGQILGDDGSNGSTAKMTKWTIGDDAADTAGAWSGNLRELNAVSGVPQVVTGTFYSTYGSAGKMVGAFGANVE